MPIPILFDDGDLMVVDKPSRMLVVDAPGRAELTVMDVLQRQLGVTVFPVHRLDEDTTGVLIVARTAEAQEAIDAMLRARTVERVYHACVSRVPSPLSGRVESRLLEDASGIVRCTTDRRGKLAITNYRTLERRKYGALVECRLETGRRNQIRVHLAELGCPIVGDRKYGYRRPLGLPKAKRPLLHASSVRFFHPLTGRRVVVAADAPEEELRRPDLA